MDNRQLVANRPDTTLAFRVWRRMGQRTLQEDLKRHFRYFGNKKGLNEYAKNKFFKK